MKINQLLKLIENPIGNWDISSLEKSEDFLPTDKRLLKSKKVEDFVRKCFKRFNVVIDVNIGYPAKKKKVGPNSIQFVIYGNNNHSEYDDGTHPLSGWMVVHRFWQASKDEKLLNLFLDNEKLLFIDPIRTAFYKSILYGKGKHDPQTIEKYATGYDIKFIAALPFTFRSARENIMSATDDIIFELLTEYSLRGRIRIVPAEEYIHRFNGGHLVGIEKYATDGMGKIVSTPESIINLQKALNELETTLNTNVKVFAQMILHQLKGRVLISS